MLPTYRSSNCFFPTHPAPTIRRHSSISRDLRAPNLLSFLMDAAIGIPQAPGMPDPVFRPSEPGVIENKPFWGLSPKIKTPIFAGVLRLIGVQSAVRVTSKYIGS